MAAEGARAPTTQDVVHPWAFVLYADQDLWHQRRLLGTLPGSSGTRFLVATPDFDVYIEDLGLADGDVAAVRLASTRWPPPAGLARDRCYRFRREPTQEQMERFLGEARTTAAAALEAEGIPAAAGNVMVPLPALAPVGPIGPASAFDARAGRPEAPAPPAPRENSFSPFKRGRAFSKSWRTC